MTNSVGAGHDHTQSGGAIVDATTFVRADQLLNEGRVGPTTLFALSNLIDGLVLFEEMNTLSPCEPDETMFDETLTRLGLAPRLLSVPEGADGEMSGVVHAENKGRNLQLGVIWIDEDGVESLPADAADPVAAGQLHDELIRGATSQFFNGSPTLEQRLNWEGKARFRSMHCHLDPEDDDYVLSRVRTLPLRLYPEEGQTYLALRCELYMALAAQHGIPYLPDALRSRLIAHGVPHGYLRILSAARDVLANADRALDRATVSAEELAPSLPSVPLSTPSLLNLVLSMSESSEDIIPNAVKLAKERTAARLRSALRGLQAEYDKLPYSRGSVDKKLLAIDDCTESFVAEVRGRTRSPHLARDVGTSILQGFITLLPALIERRPPFEDAIQSTASVLASLNPDQFRRYMLRRNLAFLRDPLAEAANFTGLSAQVARLFPRPLSDTELMVLRSLRGLGAEAHSAE